MADSEDKKAQKAAEKEAKAQAKLADKEDRQKAKEAAKEAKAKVKEDKAKAKEDKAKTKEDKAHAKEKERQQKAEDKERAAADKERVREDKRSDKERGKGDIPGSKTSDNPPLFLMIYIIVILFAFSGVGAWFFTKAWLLPKVHEMKVEKRLDRIRDDRAEKNQIGIVEKLEDIMVNTYGSTGRRYVVAELSVEAATQDIIDEVLDRESRFRDALLKYFRSYSAAELSTPEFPVKAKDEIKRIINRNLSKGWIDSVYFTKLIVN